MVRDPSGRDDRRVVGLLTALVALVAVLVVGVAAGGIVLWREYGRLRGAIEAAGDGGGTSVRDLAAEATHRQEQASRELAAAARDATRQIAEFERRAERLRQQPSGAVASAARAVEATQLMADQMLLQLKLMTTLDSVLEKTARPLDAQRRLLEGAPDRPVSARRAAPGPPRPRGP
jgi:hypothetical protein